MAIEVFEGENLVDSRKGQGKVFEPKLKRIDFCDRRVYQREEGVYYPSVTSILNAAPVDPMFLQWMQEVGKNADIIRNKAAKEGTQVHEAIENLIGGKTISWQDAYGNAKYSLKVWQMILRAADFFNTHKPEPIASELFLYSDKYKFAGTTDFLCNLNGEKWLIDWKTSNHISDSYRMQLAAYRQALKELLGVDVDHVGVMWLKAATRKPSKVPGIFQGEGWQLIEYKEPDKDFEAFLKIYDVYKIYNVDIKPYTKSYQTEVKLEY